MDANALDLGTVGVGQNLTVTTGGALTDSGAGRSMRAVGTIVSAGAIADLGRLDDRERSEAWTSRSGGEHHRSERNGSGGFGSAAGAADIGGERDHLRRGYA